MLRQAPGTVSTYNMGGKKNPAGLNQSKGHRKQYFTPKEMKCTFQYKLPMAGVWHLGNLQACLPPGYGEQ